MIMEGMKLGVMIYSRSYTFWLNLPTYHLPFLYLVYILGSRIWIPNNVFLPSKGVRSIL